MVQRLSLLILVMIVLAGGAATYVHYSSGQAGLGAPSSTHIRALTAEEVLNEVRQHKEPITLINFWASWCEPCKQEFPNLLALRSKLKGRGLNVMFISIDEVRDLPAAQAFLDEQKVDFETYYKGKQGLNFVTQIYPKWEGAVPTTLLMGKDLKLLDAWEGDASLNEFEERVAKQIQSLKGT